MCFRFASGYTEDVVQVFGLWTVGDEITLTYKIVELDGTLPAKLEPWALFIDLVGRALSRMSVASVRCRERRHVFRSFE